VSPSLSTRDVQLLAAVDEADLVHLDALLLLQRLLHVQDLRIHQHKSVSVQLFPFALDPSSYRVVRLEVERLLPARERLRIAAVRCTFHHSRHLP
jgi:hypothetical protein